MTLKLNSLNYKLHTSIWQDLIRKLTRISKSNIKMLFPDKFDDKYYGWFREIEQVAFREELRYSFEEVREKVENKNLLFLFILFDELPAAVILGYSSQMDSKKVFFLDTIAIREKGRGIGTILLKCLIDWLKKEAYLGIKVYTEEIDEKNIRLQNFYEKLGFILETKDPNGNLNMALWF